MSLAEATTIRPFVPAIESLPININRGQLPLPTWSPVSSALLLLEQARAGLRKAGVIADPAGRYINAHLAALRGGTAILAVRLRVRPIRPTSVWILLDQVAPELRDWADFFAAKSGLRVALQAGVTRLVSPQSADDLVRNTDQFLSLVTCLLRET